jgi:hypothetical protein
MAPASNRNPIAVCSRIMKRALMALALVAAAGCASNDRHVKYEDPHPPQVVVPASAAGAVIATPPAGSNVLPPQTSAAVPGLTENEAGELARAEAYRRGWREIRVEPAEFSSNRWHIHVVDADNRKAWLDLAPDGTVLKFSQEPDDHTHARK